MGYQLTSYGKELKYEPWDFGLTEDQETRAMDLHRKNIVFDCLQASQYTDEYFKVVRDAGVTVVQKTMSHNSTLNALTTIFDWFGKCRRNREYVIGPVTNFKDINEAKRQKKTAYIFGFQNTVAFGYSQIDWVKVFYDSGIRIVQLAHNWRNMVADGCGEPTDCGLSHYGMKVVDELNRLKMIVDVSHVGDQSTMEAIDRGKIVVASHANARAVCDNKRNKTDEALKAIAEKDGVIGMNAVPTMCKWTKIEEGVIPTIEDLLDHLDYIVNMLGANHVGIGFDLIDLWPPERQSAIVNSAPHLYGKCLPKEGTTGGVWPYTRGIHNAAQFPNFTRGLVSRGYSDQEIEKILGLNWMRVFKKVL